MLGVQNPVLSCVEKNSEKILTDLYCSDIIGAGVELKRACNVQDCNQRYVRPMKSLEIDLIILCKLHLGAELV